ncbi:acyl-CoA-binding domain-containing protein 6 isoform X1 [Hypanus sabinus]|uniref:acyl-CoA-binding domain-containing protein 6 isoform X1 n=1 Tax=Hypanus sabinus TaxID=79690 RepID=UPI0028C37934|nr:acyl-CoA-binding domain-containing protein 6 isoform X1 [Hypanus sabinus]
MAAAGGGGEERPRAAVGEPEEGEEEDCGCSGSALRAEFEEAAEHVIKLAHVANREKLLYLYGRFKQAKFGKCNIPKPGFFDFEGRQKWEAWKELGDMTAQQAMEEYVAAVKELDPEWQTKDLSKESGLKVRFGGPVVSSLYQEETIREEDKTIFDHCRENNIDHVLKALSNNVDVNLKDEEGRALLHWACDRGHKELVGMLLQQKAEINSQGPPPRPCPLLAATIRKKAQEPQDSHHQVHEQLLPLNHQALETGRITSVNFTCPISELFPQPMDSLSRTFHHMFSVFITYLCMYVLLFFFCICTVCCLLHTVCPAGCGLPLIQLWLLDLLSMSRRKQNFALHMVNTIYVL